MKKIFAGKIIAAASQYNNERDYWLALFSDNPVKTTLPPDRASAGESTGYSAYVFEVPAELAAKMYKVSGFSDQRLHMLLTAAVNVLLHKYTGNCDIVVGAPIYAQAKEDNFINRVLAFRTAFDPRDPFRALLLKIRDAVITACKNQNYPFEGIIFHLNKTGHTAIDNLFDTAVLLENIHNKGYMNDFRPAVTFSFHRADERFSGSVEYNSDLYTDLYIRRVSTHLVNVLRAVLDDVDITLEAIDILREEREVVLYQFNSDSKKGIPAKTIDRLFSDVSVLARDHEAIVFRGRSVRYGELDVLSDSMCARLQLDFKVGRNDLVIILLNRSDNMIISLLAVLKCGACYVPIDPGYPEQRINDIISDSAGKVIITENALLDRLVQGIPVPVLNVDSATDNGIMHTRQESFHGPGDLAYVLYTSGSTGRPKGCKIGHESLVNYVTWANDAYFNEGVQGNFPLFSSLSFDFTITSIFCTLLRGKTLYIFDEDADVSEVLRTSFSKSNPIDCIKLTPSHIRMLEYLGLTETNINVVIAGGEQLTTGHITTLRSIASGIRIFNEYGPTEATVGCVVKEIEASSDRVPIGRPIQNTLIYLLDSNLRPVPIGMPGELFISGKCLAVGYHNLDGLTAGKFVQNPFVQGERMYRTGDIGKWHENGELEYLGRSDTQVKIRGHRVELGEIEKTLSGYAGIGESVVRIAGTEHDPFVVAYYCGKDLSADELRQYLQKRLPAYMIPDRFINVEKFPLTINGKIDYKKLPVPDFQRSEKQYMAPRNATEARLARIWKEVLGKSAVGIEDNFFDEGGHSLKATQLIFRISQEFNCRIDLKTIFAHPILKDLATVIPKSMTAFEELPRVPHMDHYEVSHAQKRLWLATQFQESRGAYTISKAYLFEGRLHLKAFEQAFTRLLNRHESLRTTFVSVGGEPRQVIHDIASYGFQVDYLNYIGEPPDNAMEFLEEEYEREFDLEKGPLLKVILIQTESLRHIFFLKVHHIIADALSMQILMNDLIAFYNEAVSGNKATLLQLAIQYKDFAAWQNAAIASPQYHNRMVFWKKLLDDEVTPLDLTYDYEKMTAKISNTEEFHVKIDMDVLDLLTKISSRYETSPFTVFLSCINVLLYHMTSRTDIIVATPVMGRSHPALEHQVGFYINMILLRNRVDVTATFEQMLVESKKNLLTALDHQDHPYDLMVDSFSRISSTGHNPFLEVIINYIQQYDQDANKVAVEGLKVSRLEKGSKTGQGPYDLNFIFEEVNDRISLTLSYNSDVFRQKSISAIAENLVAIFRVVAGDVTVPVWKINEMLVEQEAILNKKADDAIHNRSLDRLLELRNR